MSDKTIRNMAASVRERLRQLAQQQGEDFQLMLTRYGLERLLYRLGQSPHRDRFILKGAMLFSLWGNEAYRATRDVDLLGFGESSVDHLVNVFRDLCRISVEDDGLIFVPDSVRAAPIRDDMEYGGIRVSMEAKLAQARIPIQADIGFGDAVTPDAADIEYPTLLDGPPPSIRAYPRETVVAEKYQAMVHLGIANSRMKDFYDLWVLARRFEFAGRALAQAIANTFKRRRTVFPDRTPLALTADFYEDNQKNVQWNAFVERSRLMQGPVPLTDVCGLLHTFLVPPTESVAKGRAFDKNWAPGGPWTG
ncbi:MAG: nucleotidyl transferase AbiEii/AbiGii toxin family protein [Acidiferrobacterales bacterium]